MILSYGEDKEITREKKKEKAPEVNNIIQPISKELNISQEKEKAKINSGNLFNYDVNIFILNN
jgi:hypothetical protein